MLHCLWLAHTGNIAAGQKTTTTKHVRLSQKCFAKRIPQCGREIFASPQAVVPPSRFECARRTQMIRRLNCANQIARTQNRKANTFCAADSFYPGVRLTAWLNWTMHDRVQKWTTNEFFWLIDINALMFCPVQLIDDAWVGCFNLIFLWHIRYDKCSNCASSSRTCKV